MNILNNLDFEHSIKLNDHNTKEKILYNNIIIMIF